MNRPPVWRLWASLSLIVASGFAGLGYQIVWAQQSALWLGHESAAVLAVIAAFFGGLAVGGMALGGRIEASPRPVAWYAGCELMIATWSALLVVTMPVLSRWLLALTGQNPAPLWQWFVAFSGAFLCFLPATAAMGATLPAMERIIAAVPRTSGRSADRSIAGLYAANTLGAVFGALGTAFWLIPAVGLSRTIGVCVACNLLCSAGALVVFPKGAPVPRATTPETANATSAKVRLALTGLLGIGYEVVVVRVLSQVTEDTVYTFAILLALYLGGTAVGAAAYHRWGADRPDRARWRDLLLGLLALTCLMGAASLWGAESVKTWAHQRLGDGVAAALGAEALLALLAFGPPTLVMGALFSHLCGDARIAGVPFGRAMAVNTMGAAVAPVVFGVLAVPALGAKLALLLVAVGYLSLVAWQRGTRFLTGVPAIAAVALAVWAPPLAFIDVPPGGRVLRYREGVMAAVSVVEDRDGVARLRINNRQQEGSSATRRVDGRQAWLPVLLHPAPHRALFLGLGTGVTAGTAAADPALHVDAVELLPEVIAASPHFIGTVNDRPENSRLHVMAADARRYLRVGEQRYDVIVSDNFHPARSGSGALYTVEHFAAVNRRLTSDGVFCQWLPLHQLDLQTLRSIVQSFLIVAPHAWAMVASNSLDTPVLGLVARAPGVGFDPTAVRARVGALSHELNGFGLEDEIAVLGSFVAGPRSLRQFAGDAPPNTDDRPVVAHRAPRITYAPDSSPRDRLADLLRALSLDPSELLLPETAAPTTSNPAWPARLTAYWLARNQFIAAGRDVRPSPNVVEMLAQVRAPLLSILRASPDFRPAYDPLLAMAAALARTDASRAAELLGELVSLQPNRPEARQALAAIRPTAAAQPQ